MMKLDIQFFSDEEFPEEDFPESNMNIGFPEVTYTKIYSGNEVTQIKAEVRVPATDTGVSGYVKLGSISGWTLSDNDTKLTKTYTFNQTETITLTYISFNGVTFDNVTNMEVIEIYDIDGSKYIRTNVEYTRVSDGSTNVLTHATILVSLKDAYVGSYKISTNNADWVVSADGTFAQKDVYVNDTFLNTIGIYPAGETESDSNRIFENFTYSVSCVGLTVADAEVTFEEKKSDSEVIGTKVTVSVPYTLDGKTGNAILGNVEGWILSENKKELSKNFLENTTEKISIPVIEANGYVYGNFYLDGDITVNAINYKKIVKGRCGTSRCLYDVYTKAEMENFKLKLEQQLEELKSLIS